MRSSKGYFASIILALALIAFGTLLPAASARAAEDSPLPTALTIQPLDPVTVGEDFTIVAQLTSSTGDIPGAVNNEALELFIDGVRERRTRTNFAGVASFPIRRFLPVGQYTVTVVYAGSRSLQPASATATLTIAPAVLEIKTVPALAGVTFSFNGQTLRSGADGVARVEVSTPGIYPLEVLPIERDDMRAEFSRWGDEIFTTAREVEIPEMKSLEVGFDVSYQASFSFVDLAGLPVDPKRITSITLKSSLGETRTLTDPGPEWFKAGRVVRRFHGLEETPVQWSVESVIIGGTNVVNQFQQRFYLQPGAQLQIELLLYAARFTARDALFGFPLGEGIKLQYPDGSVEVIPFGPDRQAFVTSLPRGEYLVSVAGAPGLSPASPVALSKNQEAELLVISYLDMAVAGVLVALLAVGLLLVGRPHLLTWLRLPVPSHGYRTAALAMTGATLVIVLTVFALGSGRAPAESTDTPLPVQRQAGPPAKSTTETGAINEDEAPAPESSPAVPTPESAVLPEEAIAEVFRAFWERNGGLSTFGYPISEAVEQRDPRTGQVITVQEFERARLEHHPELSGTPYEIQLGLLGYEDAASRGLLDSEPFQRREPAPEDNEDCTYFWQTGHRVCSHFRAYWRSRGLEFGDPDVSLRESLGLFGYPISEEFVDPQTGMRVQYFERARLEYHPEHAGTPHEVLPGQLERGSP